MTFLSNTFYSSPNRRAQILPKGSLDSSRDNAPLGQEGNTPEVLQSEARRHTNQKLASFRTTSLGESGSQGCGEDQSLRSWL